MTYYVCSITNSIFIFQFKAIIRWPWYYYSTSKENSGYLPRTPCARTAGSPESRSWQIAGGDWHATATVISCPSVRHILWKSWINKWLYHSPGVSLPITFSLVSSLIEALSLSKSWSFLKHNIEIHYGMTMRNTLTRYHLVVTWGYRVIVGSVIRSSYIKQ